MASKMQSLGVGLIPGTKDTATLAKMAQRAAQTFDLSFFLKPPSSLPHVTLFQGVFPSEEEVIRKVRAVDYSFLSSSQKIQGMDIFAKKVLFITLQNSKDLQRAHELTFHMLSPLCNKAPADTQDLQGITAGQKKSLVATGYPFSRQEFLPHFTLAHFRVPPKKGAVLPQLTKTLLASSLGKTISFEKLVVYKVGPLGRCVSLVYQKGLA